MGHLEMQLNSDLQEVHQPLNYFSCFQYFSCMLCQTNAFV